MITTSEILHLLHQGQAWLYPSIAVVTVSFVLKILVKALFKKLHIKAQSTHNMWDDALTGAAIAPISILIWLICVTFIVHLLQAQNVIESRSWLSNLLSILYVANATWFFWRFISRLEKISLKESPTRKVKDATTIIAIAKLARIIIGFIALITLMQMLGYSMSGLLAFGGIGGLAVSFAAKDLLANLFGGLMIYMDSPFKVGEWIRTPGHPIEGTVEYIGWRQTRIRTFDRRPLYVPNSTFVSMPVENPSRMQNRRIKTSIGLRYEDNNKLENLLIELRSLLANHPDLDTKRTTFIYFNNFGPSSLDCQLYCFTKTTDWVDWLAIQEKVFLDIIKVIHKYDADIAFPTTTVHWPDTPQANLPSAYMEKNSPSSV